MKELLTDLLAEEYPTRLVIEGCPKVILKFSHQSLQCSNYLHKRRLDGALNRVPPNFYIKGEENKGKGKLEKS